SGKIVERLAYAGEERGGMVEYAARELLGHRGNRLVVERHAGLAADLPDHLIRCGRTLLFEPLMVKIIPDSLVRLGELLVGAGKARLANGIQQHLLAGGIARRSA